MFSVTVRTGFNPLVRREFKCDLVDHDKTGDIRLYKYKEGIIDDLELVYKFESHAEFIESVEWID